MSTMMLSVTDTLLLTLLCVFCQQTHGITYVKSVGCLYKNNGTVHLHCERPHRIFIVNVSLGITSRQCKGQVNCCQLPTDHTLYKPQVYHLQQLKKTCNGHHDCVSPVNWKWINATEYTDYVSVVYICSKSPPKSTLGCSDAPSTSLELRCDQDKHIEIVDITFGLSAFWCQSCCPEHAICTQHASTQQMLELKMSCNGQQECPVTVSTKQCEVWTNYWGTTDHEHIRYFCINNPPEVTTTSLATTEVTTSMNTTLDKSDSFTAPSANSSEHSARDDAKNHTNTSLIASLMAAACVVVIATVLLIIIYRRREPDRRLARTNQPEMNLYAIRDSNLSTIPETNAYDTITSDTKMQPFDDARVYYNNIHTEVTPGDEHIYNNIEQKVVPPGDEHMYYNSDQAVLSSGVEHVYYNKQSGERGARKKREDNVQTSTDELLSKQNKQNKPVTESHIIYAQVKSTDTDQQVNSRETSGGSDVIMVENELYN